MSLLPLQNYIKILNGIYYPKYNSNPNLPNYHSWYMFKYTDTNIEATKYDNYQLAELNMRQQKKDNMYLEAKIIPIIKWMPEIYKTYKIKNEFNKNVKYITP
jgi:hypothetical protein